MAVMDNNEEWGKGNKSGGSGGGGGRSGGGEGKGGELSEMLSMEERFRVVSFNAQVDRMSVEDARELLKQMHEHLLIKNRVLVGIMRGESAAMVDGLMKWGGK